MRGRLIPALIPLMLSVSPHDACAVEASHYHRTDGFCRATAWRNGHLTETPACEQDCEYQEHPFEFHDWACTRVSGVRHYVQVDQKQPVEGDDLPH